MGKPSVLIVEDNKINALVLRKAIDKFCEPIHVINDKETFNIVEKHAFHLIYMDINLGSNSLDGEAIMKRLKQNPKFSHIPIFAVTSYAMPGDRERFLNAGFDSYYSKPIDKKAILQGLHEILEISVP